MSMGGVPRPAQLRRALYWMGGMALMLMVFLQLTVLASMPLAWLRMPLGALAVSFAAKAREQVEVVDSSKRPVPVTPTPVKTAKRKRKRRR